MSMYENFGLPSHHEDFDDLVLQALVAGQHRQENMPLKAGRTVKSGGRATRKGFIVRQRGMGVDHNTVVRTSHYRKDIVNRKHIGEFKFFAFPSFDRSDALLFVPTTLARYFNGGDEPAMMQLLGSRASQDCVSKVKQLHSEEISIRTFVRVHKLLTELHPDVIMVVHATKVIENQIRATAFVKFTSNKAVHEGVSQAIQDPVLSRIFPTSRLVAVNRCLARSSGLTEAEHRELFEIADTDDDLQFHSKVEIILTVNHFTKKITNLAIEGEVISVTRV